MSKVAVEVEALVKRYGRLRAVDGVSFTVERGEIFGMVGPNGAGKTTTIECVEGLRRPDAGRLKVLGLEPGAADQALRRRIGIQLQESNLPPRLRVIEAMRLFASFYPRPAAIEPLLDRLDLAAKRRTFYADLSGGQKQRLSIALALVNDPELIFLDELTTGLDPHARRAMWTLVEAIRDRGRTVLLTTHFMEEAEVLCDRVAILHRGRIVALDSPRRLVQEHGGGVRIHLQTSPRARPERLRAVAGVRTVEEKGGALVVGGDAGKGGELLRRLLASLADDAIEVTDVHTRAAGLEDVFLALTGGAPEHREAA